MYALTAESLQGLQDEIKLVPLSLTDKPAWYREKVYPVDKALLSPLLFSQVFLDGALCHFMNSVKNSTEN